MSGDAWTWWEGASGRYNRGSRPVVGGVLVIARTPRLPHGHLAVVSGIVSAREIRVDHANWATGRDRGKIARGQPVADVSAANDWSMVRVWYPPSQALGAGLFPAKGFIRP